MKPVIDLLVTLRRHELTARVAHHQMSPKEESALSVQLALVRDTVPRYILKHYDTLKREERVLGERPALLAMATLVSAYQALPRRKRRSISSFFDLATYSPRN